MKNVADIYPLTPVQLGMLFHTLANPEAGVYVNQYACKLQGAVQPAVLRQAWQATVARHLALRTAFLWDGLGQPLQVVRQKVEISWQELDWRAQTAVEQTAGIGDFLQRDRAQGFNLAQAPVSRLTLVQLGDHTYQFVWSYPHILLDGWSLLLVWQDVLVHYAARLQGKAPELPGLRPYRDYIAWQQAQNLDVAEAFWRQQLQGFSELTPLPAARTGEGTMTQPYRRQLKALSAQLVDALKVLARQHRLTLNTLVQGAWALLLHHFSDRDQVTYGSVVSGRPAELRGVETMVGVFINTLPVSVAIASDQPLITWLQARQQQLLELRQHEATPLTAIQGWSALPTGTPLFESIVAFENLTAAPPPPLAFETRDVQYLEQSNYPLALLVFPSEGLDVVLLYDPGRFEDAAIARLLEHMELLLTAFVQQPQATLAELPRLTAAEVQRLTLVQGTDYRRDGRPPIDHLPIHHLIEDQVGKTPDAPAVVFEGQTLTYTELNQRVNQLAHYLRSQGVGPGGRVALCLNRSLEMIVGILAVLKAGAAYVPLDPTYPLARLDYCLGDTQPQLLLTQGAVSLPNAHLPRLYLDEPAPELKQQPSTNPTYLASCEDLAYIIYTSGSSGQPKGVMVSHRNLVHSTTARFHVYPDPVERFLLLSSIAFDSSMAGLFWTLCQGGTLVLARQRIEQDLQQLAHLIAQERITHTLCVPSLYSLLLAGKYASQLTSLRTVIVAGEACSRTVAQKHHGQLPYADLYNEYGPTEATVWCTAYRVPAELAPGPIPIGYAIPNTQLYLLDSTLSPVPTGAIGELYIGGEGVSQGYLNRPEQTAAAFVEISRRAEELGSWGTEQLTKALCSSARLYKTGDLARYRADGSLEWLGRCDRQVKIRGYRIELGEIEDALRQYGDVQEAVVVARSTPPDSVENLVAALATLEPTTAERLLTAVEEGR